MPQYPSLYQINTRIWLNELSSTLGQRCTLANVPDAALDVLAARGFDWIYLLGVWQTGPAGRHVSLTNIDWRNEYSRVLPDWHDQDVVGSPFAIHAYHVHPDFGGDEALAALRRRLADRGLRLLLDFVPNHTALDHPWVRECPQFYMPGDDGDLVREPFNYCRLDTLHGTRVLAHGRDPFFPGWVDTLQLNYRHPGLQKAMLTELLRIAGQCDGVRCDMAMLLLPDVIARVWGERSRPPNGLRPVDTCFWPDAIAQVRRQHPDFIFMAEVYWDLEWTLQQLGFDYTYDKRFYDRLHQQDGESVRGHLKAALDYQTKSVRFLENHDEPRAAAAFPASIHEAAAMVAHLVPGMRFFHDGELEGRVVRSSLHLGRRAVEPVDARLRQFYGALLDILKRPEVRQGTWQMLNCRPTGGGNYIAPKVQACVWELGVHRLLVAVNYGPLAGWCNVDLPLTQLHGKTWRLHDLLTHQQYDRSGDDLVQNGLFLEMPAWAYFAFDWSEVAK
jgi:hypothetical protein